MILKACVWFWNALKKKPRITYFRSVSWVKCTVLVNSKIRWMIYSHLICLWCFNLLCCKLIMLHLISRRNFALLIWIFLTNYSVSLSSFVVIWRSTLMNMVSFDFWWLLIYLSHQILQLLAFMIVLFISFAQPILLLLLRVERAVKPLEGVYEILETYHNSWHIIHVFEIHWMLAYSLSTTQSDSMFVKSCRVCLF